ncbi:MAG TPA: hypothetical protein VFQ22_13300, partial [Longimicrobiales bacterium]|nr:hypothetical protein [Longimicrobiales bacterium]
RLFHAIDPSPLAERDLDPGVEEFIVEWSREVSPEARLCLSIRLSAEVPPDDAARVREAVSHYFEERAQSARIRLRRLFQVGRTSLVIGLVALAAFTLLAQVLRGEAGGLGTVLQQSLSIGGWVAMWRPLEIFLYEWWPIRADAKLFDRLAVAPVRFTVG